LLRLAVRWNYWQGNRSLTAAQAYPHRLRESSERESMRLRRVGGHSKFRALSSTRNLEWDLAAEIEPE
jgi:hypothetical protein